ncbi:hypothetical protein BG011_008479 [Mortierella polycephala]|uniref:Carboxylesterase type B domain-containing protein n=1 Tax=Mortierella polycephala TaxID=41804 RepID=A0A9P6QCH7_9FUNG|nr:hypothetical protein BG011_008479 [Mortierella polycephala]
MTFIHGGGFQDGNNGILLYDASNFVQRSIELNRPVLIATINYRLNVFGFLASKDNQSEIDSWTKSSPLNGFAPTSALSVTTLTMSQHLANLQLRSFLRATSIKKARHNSMSCSKHSTSPWTWIGRIKMTRLQAVETEAIILAGSGVAAGEYSLCYDNGKVFLALTALIQTRDTDQLAYDPNIKSIMVSANKDEDNGIASVVFGECSLENYSSVVQKFAPKMAVQFESTYGTYPTQVLCDKLQERTKVHGGFKLVRYHFDAGMQKMNESLPGVGAMYGGELPYVFRPPMIETVLTEQELKLSRAIQVLWIGFANQQDYEVMPRFGEKTIVMTNDYSIEIGKSKRLTDQLKAQAAQERLLNREK